MLGSTSKLGQSTCRASLPLSPEHGFPTDFSISSPFVSYDNIANNGTRLWSIGSFDDFKRDLAANQVPQFVFVSINFLLLRMPAFLCFGMV
jgi:hypothetical protein